MPSTPRHQPHSQPAADADQSATALVRAYELLRRIAGRAPAEQHDDDQHEEADTAGEGP